MNWRNKLKGKKGSKNSLHFLYKIVSDIFGGTLYVLSIIQTTVICEASQF